MTGIIIFLLICAVAWLFIKRNEHIELVERLEARLHLLELELSKRSQAPPSRRAAEADPEQAPAFTPPPTPTAPKLPPPIPPSAAPQPTAEPQPASTAPKLPPQLPPILPPQIPVPQEAAINWEKFLGVKLFAWIGGLLLFLAAAFFIQHAFQKNWITPQIRVTLGYLTGLGLVVGGLLIPRQRHAVTVQTLCATGLLILYTNIFASHSNFKFIGVTTAFVLMALVTAAAIYLAMKLNAQVVAVLGLLGGFLTPRVLSTGTDHAIGLFGYLALLDLGLLAVALRQRWNYLALLAAIATAVAQFAWVHEFFIPEKNSIAMTVFAGFSLLFVAAFAVANRCKRAENFVSVSAIVVLASAMWFALYLLWHPHRAIAQNVVLVFSFVFLIDAGFLVLAALRNELRLAQVGAGGAVFLLLSSWTAQYLTAATLNAALGFYVLFAVLHSAFPVVLQRFRPGSSVPAWSHVFPALALLLILLPIAKDTELSWLLWPVVLTIDLLAIVLAVLTASLVSILAVFVLTALITATWIMQVPVATPDLPAILLVVGGFAVFFMGAAVFAGRKVLTASNPEGTSKPGALMADAFGQIASLSATLPFLLLTLVVLRLPTANPTHVFAVGAGLAMLLLSLVRFCRVDWLALVGLVSVLLLEHAWHIRHFTVEHPGFALGWYLGFGLLFLAFPFLFQKRLEPRIIPWVTSALSLPLHFLLIYRGVLRAFPDLDIKGIIPAALAIPCLAALARLVLTVGRESAARNRLFALFGGVSLFFITFIFPIQYERHWLTIGWTLEGLALVWLFRRVPHPGLRIVGTALLVSGFVRLALNPWVITAYGRTGTPLWNWYLYTYGIVCVSLMLGARLLAPPRNRIGDLNVPPLLYTMGTLLAFLLVNIEIADYYSGPGTKLIFNFSGAFAQDMVYSLAWGLFAFALLAIGFKIQNAGTRYAGMGLLVLTIVKLFLHDLWRLGGLYRIGSFIGLAVVLIVVSFIYQRFLSSDPTRKPAAAQPGGAS